MNLVININQVHAASGVFWGIWWRVFVFWAFLIRNSFRWSLMCYGQSFFESISLALWISWNDLRSTCLITKDLLYHRVQYIVSFVTNLGTPQTFSGRISESGNSARNLRPTIINDDNWNLWTHHQEFRIPVDDENPWSKDPFHRKRESRHPSSYSSFYSSTKGIWTCGSQLFDWW